MKFQNIIVYLLFSISFSISAQDMKAYTSGWEGKIENTKTFNFSIEIAKFQSENPIFIISNDQVIIEQSFKKIENKMIRIDLGENLSFEGIVSENNNEINGFIKSGILLYHIKLTKTKTDSFTGVWNILMVDKLKSQNFYLSLENGAGNNYQAYPVLGDNRFTGTWCANFQKENDIIYFSDIKTGLKFKGKLGDQKIQLSIYLDRYLITQIALNKSQADWQIGNFKTDKQYKNHQNSKLDELEYLISIDSLPNTHAILISKKGKTIYENYFDGYNSKIPHDTRSVSKSISSAIVGIAKDKSLFKNLDQSIFEFLPEKYQVSKDDLKHKIDFISLLTMSSGLDAIDFGTTKESKASEDSYQNSQDWTKTVVDASMIHEPNKFANYGSANPYLLGVAMDSIVSGSLEIFIDNNLFKKLGISNYIIQTDNIGRPYFGGGMYLTPKDMMKFGQLYLQKGKWENEQVLSEQWIVNSFKNYRNLENTNDKNGYGFFWWHHTYQVNGKAIKSIEARGTGGQYIFVLPALQTVVVITSGNYRNGKFQQPELILEKYILPNIKE
ncbi:serine hydrolase domain-containing protein [Kordia sp.]|uniref:serine hydrolase domain-containing protein n=1 Tax=Kordia sp. TaxID=1965332 RepID=UPI003D2820D3